MFFVNRELPPNYHLINNPKKLSWLRSELLNSEEMAFDIETNHPTHKGKTKPEGFVEKLGGVSFSWNYKQKDVWEPGTAAYIPIIRSDESLFWKSRHDNVMSIIEEILSSDIDKIAQNGKFDVRKLAELSNIMVRRFTFDVMLAHSIIDEARSVSSHALKSDSTEDGTITKMGMSDAYLNTSASQFKNDLDSELKFYDPKYKRYTKVPFDTLYLYACSDSDYALSLKYVFKPMLEDEGMTWLFDNLVMPLQHELTIMELHGIPVDLEVANKVKLDQEILMEELGSKVYEICGKTFNIGSDVQLGDILFGLLGLKGEKNEHGQWKTDAETLEKLNHPIIKHLAKWKRAQKIHGSYAVASLNAVNEITNEGRIGWIHPSYYMETLTGRLTMSDPTMNALPRPENGGDIVKSMYAGGDDYRFIFKDYSQIELRQIAHFSQEPVWIEGFNNDHDMHSAMAQRIWHPECDVNDIKKLFPDSRSNAKAVNFGIAFGKTDWSLAKDLGITIEAADKLINEDYFGVAPVLKGWIDSMHQFAIDNGYVYNIFGRRRHLPDAWLEVPESVYWPKKDERPSCYRNGPNVSELGIELEEVKSINFKDLDIKIRGTGHNFLMKCVECPHVRSCIWNREVRYLSGRFQKAMRQAVNAPIQGSAVDMTSLAMVWIGRELRRLKLDASCLMHGHDEIATFSHISCVEQVDKIMDYYMVDYMREFTNFSIPLKVDTAIVHRWSSKHEK